MGSVRSAVYLITFEGTDADVRERFPEVFSGIGKLLDFQLELHVNCDVKLVAQPVRRVPFGLIDKVDKKLLEKAIAVQPSKEKVAAIRNAEPLQYASVVRLFLGLVQYSSKFSLLKLMRTDQRFVWGTVQ